MPNHDGDPPIPSTSSPIPVPGHPQLVALQISPTAPLEYRAYNWRRLSSGRIVRGDGWSLLDIAVIAGLAWAGTQAGWSPRTWWAWVWLGCVLLFARLKTNTVLYQSATPLAGLGLQLSTTRGLSVPALRLPFLRTRLLVPLSTSRTFVPLRRISSVIINEGLQRWSARYYLAVILKDGEGVIVVFDEVRCPHAVLREVYHGVREALFDEFDDAGSDDTTHHPS